MRRGSPQVPFWGAELVKSVRTPAVVRAGRRERARVGLGAAAVPAAITGAGGRPGLGAEGSHGQGRFPPAFGYWG